MSLSGCTSAHDSHNAVQCVACVSLPPTSNRKAGGTQGEIWAGNEGLTLQSRMARYGPSADEWKRQSQLRSELCPREIFPD